MNKKIKNGNNNTENQIIFHIEIGVKKMKIIDTIALVLVIIGAIVWGLIGLFNFNLVEMIFGNMTIISRIIYVLVGISGLWAIKLLFDHD